MTKEKERYIAMSTNNKPAKEERYLKFTAVTRLKEPPSESPPHAKCSPPKLSIPLEDKPKIAVMKKEHLQTLTPKEKWSNIPAPNTRTALPAYIVHEAQSPTVAATTRPAYYGFQGAIGDNLLTKRIQRVRLEHERVMKEERGQNCCLCGLLMLSIFMGAALLAVVFYDRTASPGSANLTESEEIGSFIYFEDVEFNQHAEKPLFNTGRNIIGEAHTKTSINYTRVFKNLTELCSSKIEPQGCFYHKNIYPDNCVSTRCNSIIVNIITRNVDGFDWHLTHELATVDVEDWTPCAPGKLCLGGKCVEHPDALHYVVPEAHPGGVRVMCNSSRTCVRIDGTLIQGKAAERYMSCERRSCEHFTFPNYLFHNEMAIRFLSCSNPYPVEMDPGCFPPVRSLVSEYAPFVLYDFCLICLPAVSNDSCFTYIYSYVPKFGVPCYSGSPKIKNTFCAGGGACVPLYKDYPETYSIRPIQKC